MKNQGDMSAQLLGVKKQQKLRVGFWTHFLCPNQEAISNEVWALHRKLKKSFVFGLSAYYWFNFSLKQRVIGFNFKGFILLRLINLFIGKSFQLHHIYADLRAWHYLKILKHRPVILSVVTDLPPLQKKMYKNINLFIVQSKEQKKLVARIANKSQEIKQILPGVDLKRFKITPVPRNKPFTVLFASTPIQQSEYFGRGLDLLIDLAERKPEIQFFIAWRMWGEKSHTLFEKFKRKRPLNIRILERQSDIKNLYKQCHVTIAPFRKDGGKTYPHSIMESLACGKPVLVSNVLAIAEIVKNERVGEVFEPTLNGALRALERLKKVDSSLSHRARKCAEKYFSQDRFVEEHLVAYQSLIKGNDVK